MFTEFTARDLKTIPMGQQKNQYPRELKIYLLYQGVSDHTKFVRNHFLPHKGTLCCALKGLQLKFKKNKSLEHVKKNTLQIHQQKWLTTVILLSIQHIFNLANKSDSHI